MTTTFAMEDVLILGGTGLLGTRLVPFLSARGHRTVSHDRPKGLEIKGSMADENITAKVLSSTNPSVILNLIGMTDVDQCESMPNEAYLTNTRVVENIASWIRQKRNECHLIHISTDQVYDGHGPHTEKDVTLTNYYAFSKYAGELAANGVESSVLRTNFFGLGRHHRRNSFTDWLFSALSNQKPIPVFDDVQFSPLSMTTLSTIVDWVIQKKPRGVFNIGSHGGMSKADFAFAFAEELGFSTSTMRRTSTNAVEFLKTYRPKDMRMDCCKFETMSSFRLPELTNEIKRAAEEYRETS